MTQYARAHLRRGVVLGYNDKRSPIFWIKWYQVLYELLDRECLSFLEAFWRTRDLYLNAIESRRRSNPLVK